MTKTTERQQEAAELTGLNPEEIGEVRLQLDLLRQQGILVDLTVTGTSMFTRAATWAELGILPKDARRKRFTKGSKYLIPEKKVKKLKSIETRMRQVLNKYSYSVTGFQPYRWIPYTAYEEWREEFYRLRGQFRALKAEIIERYSEYEDALIEDFADVAQWAWRALSREGYSRVEVDGRTFDDVAEFVQFVINRAASKMPDLERIESELNATYITALVYGQSDIAADRLRASELEASARQIEAKAEHTERMAALEQEEKLAKINAMREAELAHAKERLQEIGSPFEQVFGSLRQRFAEDAEAMLKSIKKNGTVRGKIATKGAGLIEFYELMAIHDDGELKEKLSELKEAIGPIGDDRTKDTPDRSPEAVSKTLQQIVDIASKTAEDLSREPSRFAFVEV